MLVRKMALLAASSLSVTLSPAMAEDLIFLLHNESSFDVTEFYASPIDVGDWEQDILGEDVLRSGETLRVTIANSRSKCDYDMRIVFDDGDTMEDQTNICETGDYTITD